MIIEDLVEGDGDVVAAGDPVLVSYVGMLEDGTVFDASDQHEIPLAFTVGVDQVIEGWDQGLIGMKEGGTRRLTIPPHLAFGRQGREGFVPGNATVIFEITVERILDEVYVEDLVVGEGPGAVAGNQLRVSYVGYLLGEIEFDRAESFTFELGNEGLIQGWNIGLEGMREGGKRMLIVPYNYGYGPLGNGTVPSFAVLTFVVDLIQLTDLSN